MPLLDSFQTSTSRYCGECRCTCDPELPWQHGAQPIGEEHLHRRSCSC